MFSLYELTLIVNDKNPKAREEILLFEREKFENEKMNGEHDETADVEEEE